MIRHAQLELGVGHQLLKHPLRAALDHCGVAGGVRPGAVLVYVQERVLGVVGEEPETIRTIAVPDAVPVVGGLVAQEVEKLFPELVRSDASGYKAVAYDKLSVVLLQGMKEQQQQIESAREENTRLQYELQSLKERMEQIEAMVAKNGMK